MEALLIAAGLALAYANGANDNFKGVATVYGSGQLSYGPALRLATVSQIAGSLASAILATALVKAFSGKGLVPPEQLTTELLASVALGAALTVGLATRVGLPISTTHAIVGALVGAGAMQAGSALNLAALGTVFIVPLALGPFVAVLLAWAVLRGGIATAGRLDLSLRECVCVGHELGMDTDEAASLTYAGLSWTFAHSSECAAHESPRVAGVEVDDIMRFGHIASATVVGFARGLNDTPKILGLLVGVAAIDPISGALVLGASMAIGGLVSARRVADPLALEITPMDNGQGLAANLATSLLVIGASRFGLPVSTTHVSTGGIFGIGAAGGTLEVAQVRRILGAWLGTLPLAAVLGAVLAWCLG